MATHSAAPDQLAELKLRAWCRPPRRSTYARGNHSRRTRHRSGMRSGTASAVRGVNGPCANRRPNRPRHRRSEEHTSELQSLMRISYAVFCLKKKNNDHYRIEQNITAVSLERTTDYDNTR